MEECRDIADIAKKLQPDSPEDAEFIVAKAPADLTGTVFCSVMDRETSMMSTAADELLEASFSRIKILDNYKDQLTHLSELKPSKRKYNRRGYVKCLSSRAPSPLSCPEITESLEKLQKTEGEINEAQQKNEELLKKLKISANSHEHVVVEILSATAKRLKVKNQINFSSASARKLIQEMSLCEFQRILEGRVVVGFLDGGKELPLPEVIQMLIRKNHVTEASESLRAAADKIDEFIWALFQQFSKIKRLLEKIATEKHEEQPARETDTQQVCKNRNGQMSNVDISVPFKDSSTDPPQGHKSCAKSQTHQRNEDEQEGPPPEERRGQEEGESVQNAQIGGDQQRVRCAMSYRQNEEWSQGSEESYSELDDDESYHPSPDDSSDSGEFPEYVLECVQPSAVAFNGDERNWALLNCHSIRRWIRLEVERPFNEFLLQHNLEVLILTETWLRSDTGDQELLTILPNAYAGVYSPREGRRGGGVAIIFLNDLHGQLINLNYDTTAFEYVAAELNLAGRVRVQRVLVICVYRPPSGNFNQFQFELQNLLVAAYHSNNNGNIILAGDFNVRVNTNEERAHIFLELLEELLLVQHVRDRTHRSGNTLDLVISSRNVGITVLMVQRDTGSDHYTVYFRPQIRRDSEQESEAEDEEDD